MPRNRVQHQKGLSDHAFKRLYPDEEAYRMGSFRLWCSTRRRSSSTTRTTMRASCPVGPDRAT
jgi:hypothetical protein